MQSISKNIVTNIVDIFNVFIVNLLFIQFINLSIFGFNDAIKYIDKNPQNIEKYTHTLPFIFSGISE